MQNKDILNELLTMREQLNSLIERVSYSDTTQLRDIPMSTRALNAVKACNAETLTPMEFVYKIPQKEFLRHYGTGKKSLLELENILSKLGLNWK